MTNSIIRKLAREHLGGKIFSSVWLWAVLIELIFSIITTAGSEIGIIAILVTAPLAYGIHAVFLKNARDSQNMEVGDLFSGFKTDFACNLLIGLMTSIFTFLWALLFIIPGVVKSYSYSFAFYVKADNPEYNWAKCIKKSNELTNGHKFNLFCLDLSFIGWYILGALCLGVGTLWVSVYHRAAKAQMYNSIVEYNAYTAEQN